MLYFIDSSPQNKSSHSLEYKEGFKTAAKLTVEEDGGYWHVYSVFTSPDYRGRGLAKALVEHIEQEYGPVKLQSENDGYWDHIGFVPGDDGWWKRSGT